MEVGIDSFASVGTSENGEMSDGGISRVTFQMDNAQMNHAQLMRSIEVMGMQMSPLLND